MSVQQEEDLQGGVPSAIVAVDKRVIVDKAIGQRGGLVYQVRIEVGVIKGHPWLRHGGFEGPKVPKAGGPTGGGNDLLMQE